MISFKVGLSFSILLFSTFAVCNAETAVTQNNLNGLPAESILQQTGDTLLKMPTAFLPYSRKEINGTFGPVYDKNSAEWDVKKYEILIYERRGALIFKSNDINVGWDGKYKNKSCPTGSYVYIMRYVIVHADGSISTHEKKGNVLLVE